MFARIVLFFLGFWLLAALWRRLVPGAGRAGEIPESEGRSRGADKVRAQPFPGAKIQDAEFEELEKADAHRNKEP